MCVDIFLQFIVRYVVGHVVPSYLSNTWLLNLCGITKPCTKLSSAASTPPGILIPSKALNLSFRSSYFSCASFWCNFSFSVGSSRSRTVNVPFCPGYLVLIFNDLLGFGPICVEVRVWASDLFRLFYLVYFIESSNLFCV